MAETALELAQDDPNAAAHLCEANEILLALKKHKLLQEINDWDAETLLGTDKSKAYFQLSRSITPNWPSAPGANASNSTSNGRRSIFAANRHTDRAVRT